MEPDNTEGDLPNDTTRVNVRPVSALVPQTLSRGVFSTGVIVMTGNTEFVFDFIQNLGAPNNVVARVICPHSALGQIVDAIQRNVQGFHDRFGKTTATADDSGWVAVPQSDAEPDETESAVSSQIVGAGIPLADEGEEKTTQSPHDVYEDMKLADDIVAGAYANGLMIGHTSSEFKLDFLANLYPKSVVTSRVFMSAPQLMRLLDTLQRTLKQYERRS